MRQIDRCQLDMLIKVRAFGASHGQLFPDTSPVPAALTAIGTEIDHLEALDVAEQSARQAARVARKQSARKALVRILTRAGSTARVLARANPAFNAQVGGPLPADDLEFLTLARHFAGTAAPWAELFGTHALRIAEVEERIAVFEQALQELGAGRDARVKARAEIEASFARAMDAVAVMDVMVANHLETDPVALRVWKHDRRIVYPRRQRHETATTELAPAPETAAGPQAPRAGVAPATPA